MNQPTEQKKPRKKRLWLWLGIAGILLVLYLIGSSATDNAPRAGNSSNNSSDTPNSQQIQAEAEPEEKTYTLNEPVPSKDVVWTVTSVKDRGSTLKASESRYAALASPKTTSGKFIQVNLTVENKSTDLASITDPRLIDSQGREFTTSSDTSEWLPEGQELFLLENLQPNLPKQLSFIFEVPADAEGLKLKVGVFEPKLVELGV